MSVRFGRSPRPWLSIHRHLVCFLARFAWHFPVVGSGSAARETADDLCDRIFFSQLEPTSVERCRLYRPGVMIRGVKNRTPEHWEVQSFGSGLQYGMIFRLTRFYRVAGLYSVLQNPGVAPLSRIVKEPWEGLQVWADAADGITTDVVFVVRRDFVTHPVWQYSQRVAHGGKPDIYVIILDSVSRRALRRFAPRVATLFQQELPYHEAFSFESFHTICGGGTLGTVYPMFHGGIGVQSAPSWCTEGMADKAPWKVNYSTVAECYNESRRILKRGRDAGFIVGLSTNLLFQLYNEQSDAHHATNAALCLIECDSEASLRGCIEKYDMAHDIAKCSDLFCMGRDRYAKRILSWNHDFFKAYRDRPKLLASMLHGAHRSAADLNVLQIDLRAHLDSVLLSDQSPFRDSVVLLMGDHGRKTVACDYDSPLLGVFVPKRWHSTAVGEAALAAITRNARLSQDGLLVTPWDLYASLRHLMDWDQGDGSRDHFGMHELSASEEVQSHTEQHGRRFLRHFAGAGVAQGTEAYGRFPTSGPFSPKSLFAEMPATRGCEEAGVAAGHCVSDMVPVAHFTCQPQARGNAHTAFVPGHQHHSAGEIDSTSESSAEHDVRQTDPTPQSVGQEKFSETGSAWDSSTVLGIFSSHFPQVFNEHGDHTELILGLFDADGDGNLQRTEVFPIAEAGAKMKVQAREAGQHQAFWCAAGASRSLHVIEAMNLAYTQTSQGVCQRFSLLQLDRVVVSKGIHGMSLALSFTVAQGEPPSRYETTLVGRASSAPRAASWRQGSLYAASRYHKYQACTPQGLEAEFCVCGQPRVKLE